MRVILFSVLVLAFFTSLTMADFGCPLNEYRCNAHCQDIGKSRGYCGGFLWCVQTCNKTSSRTALRTSLRTSSRTRRRSFYQEARTSSRTLRRTNRRSDF